MPNSSDEKIGSKQLLPVLVDVVKKSSDRNYYKQTPEILSKLDQAFSIGCPIIEACAYAGIAEKTYYRWVEDDEREKQAKESLGHDYVSLADRFNRARSLEFIPMRLSVHMQGRNDGDLALKYLERRLPEQFKTKTQNEIKTDLTPKELADQFLTEFDEREKTEIDGRIAESHPEGRGDSEANVAQPDPTIVSPPANQ